MYNVWCVALPGRQSIFKPNPGICQECTTSNEFVITVIFTWAGKTNTLRDLKSLFHPPTRVVSNLDLAFLTNLYCLVGLPKFSSTIDISLRNGFPE